MPAIIELILRLPITIIVILRVISGNMLVIADNGYSELGTSIVLEMADFFRFLVHGFG